MGETGEAAAAAAAAVLIRVLHSGLSSCFWVGWPQAVTSPLLYPWILHAAEVEQRWSKTQKRRAAADGPSQKAAAEGERSSRIFGWGSTTQEKNDSRLCDFRRCINPFEMLLELALYRIYFEAGAILKLFKKTKLLWRRTRSPNLTILDIRTWTVSR